MKNKYERNIKIRTTIAMNLNNINVDEYKSANVWCQNDLARRLAFITDKDYRYWAPRIHRICSPTRPDIVSDEEWELICSVMPELMSQDNNVRHENQGR